MDRRSFIKTSSLAGLAGLAQFDMIAATGSGLVAK
jgi:hypothetical protein